MRRSLSALLSLLLIAGCFPFLREPEGFITVSRTRLLHRGEPYYFAGTNLWYGAYLGAPGHLGDRERLCRELDSLSARGIVNLRILAASEPSYLPGTLTPVLQPAPGEFNDTLLLGLDFLLDEMGGRDMHAVLYLNNFWEWSGGMAVYNVWARGEPGIDPSTAPGGWQDYMNYSGSFYADARANELYRSTIARIVRRRNEVNGRLYVDDPTIMSWQLANEPRPGALGEGGRGNIEPFVRWLDETAAFIHSLDTNHLVSSGSEGSVGTLLDSSLFLRSHATRQIDYLTMHLWPYNWGWHDPKNSEATLPAAEESSGVYLARHLAYARALDRPIVLEEFGLGRDGGAIASGTPTTARDRFYGFILSAVRDSAAAGAPIAGSNFWGWGGLAAGRNSDGRWRPGDPFLGDPPHEDQGINSVFLADSSTLGVITEHARSMLLLGGGAK
jgi:mannan endo-1,4-beta-mannosidase